MSAIERKRALRKARRVLGHADPALIMRELFALRGFDIIEAVDAHIQHIREGNLRALEGYMAGALPQPAKRLKIQQQTAIVHANVGDVERALQAPPQMAPRAIGSAKVGDAE